ncbi:MAG: hypothetical protein ACK4TA_10895 [Saprospiraceae bacterium]
MKRVLLQIILLCSLFPFAAAQQSLSNLRSKTIDTAPRQTLDSLTIIPNSLEIFRLSGERLDTSFYTIYNTDIHWRKPVDSLLIVRYRVFPYNLGKTYVRLDTTKAIQTEDGQIVFEYNPYAENQENLLDFKGLDYNGSFARGISFGNNQDLVLNSSFNLQLAGDIGEGIQILAAISDENIPIQPEGNTRQLQEFDRIFIQLTKNNNKLIAGDYDLQRPNSYFMNYFKRLQGATFSNQSNIGKGKLNTSASVAISRGQFARNQIQQQEGNQGPYKLLGSQGEQFIIVLAGTEKVWLDGQLLQRGIEYDYIIDYNRGEITFTNKRLITKDSRIIIEFEYSDQNYLRSFYAVNTEYQQGNFRLYGNIFNQADSRTSTGGQNLSDAQKRLLIERGDSIALFPSFDTLSFSPTRVLYKLEPVITSCITFDSVLIYSTNPDSAQYTARFSFVGAGNGNYVLDNEQIANERVYRFVEPDPITCQPRGDYAPVTQLLAPRQQQLITVGGEYKMSKTSALQTEVALSRNDLNRFSSLDANDDAGLAAFTNFNKLFKIDSLWSLELNGNYEFVQKTFQPINPYRNPEFLRDWGLTDIQGFGRVEKATENLGSAGFSLRKTGFSLLQYRFSLFNRESLYNGTRHYTKLNITHAGFELDAEGSLLNSTETLDGQGGNSPLGGRGARFFRPRVSLIKTFQQLNNWKIGIQTESEQNSRFNTTSGGQGGDSLTSASFYYDVYRAFLESPVTEKFSFGASFRQRNDYAPLGEDFIKSNIANEINVNGNWNIKRTLQLAGNFTYRKLKLLNDLLVREQPSETFLGRTDVNFTLWKGALRANNTYELGSGQEPRLEFTFVRVRQGEGTHIWLDSLYNNDGVIQPNEMEIAPFQDIADYVRVNTFVNQYIRTNYVNLNSSLQLTPKAIWFNQKGIKNFLSKFSTQSTLTINRKTLDAPDVSAWNPFQLDIADTSLVSVSSNMRNILFFNRADPKYDLQIGNTSLSNKFVQTSGFESRRNTEQFFRSRVNASRSVSLQMNLAQGARFSDSEFFDNRDYNIEYWNVEPQFTYLPSQSFRTILSYKYQQDQNTIGETPESARQHNLTVEMTYNQSASTSLRLRASLVDIAFDGNPSSPVGFAILNGLQPGKNYLWNLSLDRQLSKNLRLNLSYEGRKTGEARVVHVGRAQVAAVF